MSVLGNALSAAQHYEDALTVGVAELLMMRRLGSPEHAILIAQGNLASTYQFGGRLEQALLMRRDVYTRRLELDGEENDSTLRAANNYALTLLDLQRFEETKSLLRKTISVARRTLGLKHGLMLKMRWFYAMALYTDAAAMLDDLREAVETPVETERIARLILGNSHPNVMGLEKCLGDARAALSARETPSTG